MDARRPVILFVFAGRRANMELQLPLIKRILALHKNVEYHIWNLARRESDDAYLRTIRGDRIVVRHELCDAAPHEKFGSVYGHYADPEYSDRLFVKIDDDVVFLQVDRFGKFLSLIEQHPDTVLSAHVINNGASAALDGIWQQFVDWQIARNDKSNDIQLPEVHTSNQFAVQSHQYAFDHFDDLLSEPVSVHQTTDWLSINLIGYSWPVAQLMIERGLNNAPIPTRQAGPDVLLGDEGVVNTVPRAIVKGFLAGHLSFGEQAVKAKQYDEWRERYAELGRSYL